MPASKKPRLIKQDSRKPANEPPAPDQEDVPIAPAGFVEINPEIVAPYQGEKAVFETPTQPPPGPGVTIDVTAASATPADATSEINRLKADLVITRHVAVAASAGLIPLPVVDFAAVTGVQLTMLALICKIYKQPFSKEAATSIIASLVGGAVTGGEASSLAISSRLKFIPVVGTAMSWLVTPALAGATTYAIGKVFVRHLETGGSILTFDGQKMKGYMEKAVEEGKKRMPRWGKRAPAATAPDPTPAV
jgi:uncharacterized protein (DUF697 family)